MWYFGHMFDWMHGFSWLGGVGMLLFAVLIGLVIFFIVRSNRNSMPHNSNSTRAEDILKERLAKGEISEEEYENLLKKIRNS